MFKKIILSIVIIFMMMEMALARVDPAFVRTDQFGMIAVEWMAIIAMICAIIDNLGRAWDKRRNDSTFHYDYAYAKITFMAICMMSLGILGMEVVELNLNSIITAAIIGFGGNVGVTKATKRGS